MPPTTARALTPVGNLDESAAALLAAVGEHANVYDDWTLLLVRRRASARSADWPSVWTFLRCRPWRSSLQQSRVDLEVGQRGVAATAEVRGYEQGVAARRHGETA